MHKESLGGGLLVMLLCISAEVTAAVVLSEDLIRSVSEERLAGLRPENPDGYREYADELSKKSDDPESRRTALRLYQMAAVLEPQRLGHRCVLAMVPLAQDAAEQRRFRAMAFLLDADHDPAQLQATEPATARPPELAEHQAESLLKAVRALRQGKRKEALAQARRSKLQDRLPLLTDTITYDEFEKACDPHCPHCTRGRQPCSACGGSRSVAGSGSSRVACPTCGASGEVVCVVCRGNPKSNPLSPSLLRRILALELEWLPGADRAMAATPAARPPWSRSVELEQTAPARELTLETLTEFNPRQNRYQDGRWIE